MCIEITYALTDHTCVTSVDALRLGSPGHWPLSLDEELALSGPDSIRVCCVGLRSLAPWGLSHRQGAGATAGVLAADKVPMRTCLAKNESAAGVGFADCDVSPFCRWIACDRDLCASAGIDVGCAHRISCRACARRGKQKRRSVYTHSRGSARFLHYPQLVGMYIPTTLLPRGAAEQMRNSSHYAL